MQTEFNYVAHQGKKWLQSSNHGLGCLNYVSAFDMRNDSRAEKIAALEIGESFADGPVTFTRTH